MNTTIYQVVDINGNIHYEARSKCDAELWITAAREGPRILSYFRINIRVIHDTA